MKRKLLGIIAGLHLVGGASANADLWSTELLQHLLSGNQHAVPSERHSMDLGHWRNTIAEKILPIFYFDLNAQPSNSQDVGIIDFKAADLYLEDQVYFQVPMDNFDADVSTGHFFTFDFDRSIYHPTNFSNRLTGADNFLLYDNQILSRSFLVPGFSYQFSDSSELNVAVVFAQQNYSDINFIASEISGNNQLDLYAVSYTETSDGLGVRASFGQDLFGIARLQTGFQNKIDMEGFSRLLGVQADPADFDIPAQANLDLSIRMGKHNNLTLSTRRDYYSDVNAFVSESYPDIFLTFLNDLQNPNFDWSDLTVYSASLDHRFTDGTVISLEYATRQQPSPTDNNLRIILDSITSDYSVRMGLNSPLLGGQFDFYASFAPKPLNFGRTDFGRVRNVLEGKHIEAVMSWTYNF